MSFFTSFQELLDFDQSTNLNGFHFSNSLFGFDSNSIPALENLLPPVVVVDQPTAITNTRLKTPSPIPEPTPLLETPKQCQIIQPLQSHQQQQSAVQLPAHQNSNQQVSPIPIVSKFQLKVTPNNEIYISNESGTFCELAGRFVPSAVERKSFAEPIVEIIPPPTPEVIEPDEPEPPKTLYCIERGIKRPLSPSDQRYCNSGIFRSHVSLSSPLKKKTTSTTNNGLTTGGLEQESAAKLVVSNVINNGLIVNKKHLSNNDEQPKASTSATLERRLMRTKKKKRKAASKTTLVAKVEPMNGKIATRIIPGPTITSRKVPQQQIVGKRPSQVQDNLRKVPIKPLTAAASSATVAAASVSSPTTNTVESTLNFSGIKEKAAQEAIFIERVEKQPSLQVQPLSQQLLPSQKQQQQLLLSQQKIVQTKSVPVVEPDTKLAPDGAAIPDGTSSSPAPVELKVVADLIMDKEVFGHISLLSIHLYFQKHRGEPKEKLRK